MTWEVSTGLVTNRTPCASIPGVEGETMDKTDLVDDWDELGVPEDDNAEPEDIGVDDDA